MEFPYFHHLVSQLKYHDLLWTGKATINEPFHTGTLTINVHEILKFWFPNVFSLFSLLGVYVPLYPSSLRNFG